MTEVACKGRGPVIKHVIESGFVKPTTESAAIRERPFKCFVVLPPTVSAVYSSPLLL